MAFTLPSGGDTARTARKPANENLTYLGLLINEMIARIKKTTKQIFASQAAVPAIPPKPRTAAMRAMTRKTMA
jgi:hypothetical protein